MVIATDRDQVRWRGGDGNYLTSRDVLLPPLAWSNSTVRGERRIDARPPLLFPLKSGKSVVFTATRVVRPMPGGRPVTTQENWRCNVVDAVPVETRAGRFNTWRVACTMTEQPGSPGAGLVRRTYYYSPDIGFYVRREEEIGDTPVKVVDLADYASAEPALSANALSLRVTGIQQALESKVSGGPIAWRDAATGSAGDVRPLRTMRSDQYGWCRDFSESIQAAGRVYNLQGRGCRNTSGIWDIIALEPTKLGSG
jgi:hypothetical protein